jgi:hypothetical protein
LLDAARPELDLSIAREPKNAAFRGQLRQWHIARVQTQLALGRWKDVLAQVDEFESQNEDQMARLWALEQRATCIPMARAELAIDADGAPRLEHVEAQFVERVRALVESGYDRGRLSRMKWLAPMREHPGLVEILGPTDG